MNMIDSRQLAALVNSGSIKCVAVQGAAGGFTVTVDGQLIEAKRGHARLFRKLQTAATYLKGKGIGTFTVDLSMWSPDQKPIF